MKVSMTSKTVLNFNQITRSYNSDSHIRFSYCLYILVFIAANTSLSKLVLLFDTTSRVHFTQELFRKDIIGLVNDILITGKQATQIPLFTFDLRLTQYMLIELYLKTQTSSVSIYVSQNCMC